MVANENHTLELDISAKTGVAISSLKALQSSLKRVSSATKTAEKNLDETGAAAERAGGGFDFASTRAGRFFTSLKRIAMYRAVRSVLSSIVAGLREGTANLYAWSNAFGGEFASSMDRISTAFLYFKNSVGAAVAPIINALAPAIDFVIDKIVALLNLINQLFARLAGQTYWTKAIKQAKSYGAAASGAGSAAKEALRYLAPFDELNVLPSDSGGGSGGGGGASGGEYQFENVPLTDDGFWSSLAMTIQDVFFDWKDITLEQLLEKIIVGLGAIAGGIIGFTLGGVGGAIIGIAIGASLGLIADSLIFDHDGEVSKDELLGSIAIACGALCGGLIGFSVGGIGGALLGASIGLGVTLLLTSLTAAASGDGTTFWSGYNSPIDYFFAEVLGLPSDAEIEAKINSFMNGSAMTKIRNFISNPLGTIDNALSSAIVFPPDFWDKTISGINSGFDRLWESIESWDLYQKISDWFSENFIIADNGGWDIDAQFTQMFQNIKDAFSNAFDNAKQSIQTVFINVENFFIEKWNSFIDKLQSNTVVVKIADFLGIDLEEAKIDPIEIPVTASLDEWKNNLAEKPWSYANAYFNWANGQQDGIGGTNYLDKPWSYASAYFNWMNGGSNGIGGTSYMKKPWAWASAYFNWKYTTSSGSIGGTSYMKKPWAYASAYFNQGYARTSSGGYVALAKGGSFFGGSWHDIPQYANGTPNAGSLFVAGEAGPELVGHIGGRTEVLNASQIASAIAAGVAGATYSYDAQGMSEEMLYNAFVRALNDTDSGDIYLDGEAIYRSVRKHNDMNTRMTGVNAFA